MRRAPIDRYATYHGVPPHRTTYADSHVLVRAKLTSGPDKGRNVVLTMTNDDAKELAAGLLDIVRRNEEEAQAQVQDVG